MNWYCLLTRHIETNIVSVYPPWCKPDFVSLVPSQHYFGIDLLMLQCLYSNLVIYIVKMCMYTDNISVNFLSIIDAHHLNPINISQHMIILYIGTLHPPMCRF